eukprot:scaffold306227_cov35-Tisochrysis_lutea.AAC.3
MKPRMIGASMARAETPPDCSFFPSTANVRSSIAHTLRLGLFLCRISQFGLALLGDSRTCERLDSAWQHLVDNSAD